MAETDAQILQTVLLSSKCDWPLHSTSSSTVPMAGGHHTDGSPSSWSSDGDHERSTDLQSMTAEGIKRLCSELCEIKKASEEDFHKNISSCYSAFVRIREQLTHVNCDLEELKQHALHQSKLVEDFIDSLSLYQEKLSDNLTKNKAHDEEDLDFFCATELGSKVYETLDKLDILISEKRLNDALDLLEMMTMTLQKMQKEEDFMPMITSYSCAMSDRRTRITEQFILLAEHSRVALPALQKALTGLCRLGEHHQANVLLIKFFHLRLENHMQELFFQKASLDHMYLYEVAKALFSVISQAATSFVLLHGETYLFTPEFLDWARKEIEKFSHLFDAYMKSILETNERFHLAVETLNCAFSLCSLLRSQRLLLLKDLINYMKPCMEELLDKHLNHYRDVAILLVESETWVISKFLLSEICTMRPLSGDTGEDENFLLTSSGKKFVILLKAIVEDISSLFAFEMDISIAQGITNLVDEYISAMEQAIQSRENNLSLCGQGPQGIISTPKLEQQLLLLVNISSFVDLFPIVTSRIFHSIKPTHFSPEQAIMSFQVLVLSIKEAAARLRIFFCRQLVYEAKYNNQCYAFSGQDHLMPSSIFQELFHWLKKVENVSRSIFQKNHGIMEKLLTELMEALVVWISNNPSYFKIPKDSLDLQTYSIIEQVNIDIHFLLEIAKLGGYMSDHLMAVAMGKFTEIDVISTSVCNLHSTLLDDRWVKDTVNLAIERLLNAELVQPQLQERTLRIQVSKDVQDVNEGAAVESADLEDDVCEGSPKENFNLLNKTSIKLEDLDSSTVHVEPESEGHPSNKIYSSQLEGSRKEIASLVEDDKLMKVENKENNIKGPAVGSDFKFIGRVDTSAAVENEIPNQQDATKLENMEVNIKLLKVSYKMDDSPVYLSAAEFPNLVNDSEVNLYINTEGRIDLDLEKKRVMLQTGACTSLVETDYATCSSSETFKDEWPTS